MKIALIGYGKMGKTIEQIAIQRGHQIVSIIDINNAEDIYSEAFKSADAAIEFTTPATAFNNYMKCFEVGVPVVSGTTGWLDRIDEIKEKCEKEGKTFFYASNFSIGVNIFFAMNKYLAKIMNNFPSYDVKMTEVHHIHKLDAPSGTAITLAEGILENIDRKDRWTLENAENATDMQFNYFIETDGSPITEEQFRLMDVSKDDRMLASSGGYYQNLLSYLGFTPNANGQYNPVYRLPLTKKALAIAEKLPTVKKVIIEPETLGGPTYPVGYNTGWTRDNFGPLWIPKKGATIPLDERNLALYSRCIKNYENNTLEVKDGKVYINGKPETSYTFKYDYYWMMGDNRHNSADSRSWGFVPEDHIVGKPILVWLSLDKDRSLFDGGIRWNRLFRWVHPD